MGVSQVSDRLRENHRIADFADCIVLPIEAGRLWQLQGDFRQALAHYEQALVMAQDQGDSLHIAVSIDRRGGIHRLCGDLYHALVYFERAFICAETGLNWCEQIRALNGIGKIHQTSGLSGK